MIYIDANIFILAITNRDLLGEESRKFLKSLQKEKAATSTLTFDEIVWKVLQIKGFDAAIAVANNLIKMENLTWLDVNVSVLLKSADLMRLYRLFPRDSIHAACALNNDIFTIISEDKDFDKIKDLKRKSIKDFRI